jgi:23S rRNA (pseudouridine1915-N3)-methyltransferase
MIKIICVGKIKEKYWKDAINEYTKRLSKYTKINIVEVDDDGSDDELRSLNNEKDRILKNIKPNDYVITLEIEGYSLGSAFDVPANDESTLQGALVLYFLVN